MSGREVTLEEVLAFRDERAHAQRQLLQQYGLPVISFTMNIPGAQKTGEDIRRAFDSGKDALFRKLSAAQIAVKEQRERHLPAGDELLLAADASPEQLKQITTAIEETHPYGRLFDMDVLDISGQKLARMTPRKCLVCGNNAFDCARSRAHSVKELQDAVNSLILFIPPNL